MVVHECVGVNLEQTSSVEFSEVVLEDEPISVGADDVLAVGAPVRQMVPCAAGILSWLSSHGGECGEGVVTF